MGLDQYAYVATKAGQRKEFYETAEPEPVSNGWISAVSKPRDLAYWRKHPNLQGWMEKLWIQKGKPIGGEVHPDDWSNRDSSFNGIELELTWQDLADLEDTVRHNQLPETDGFFFGRNADNEYYEDDLKFCIDAKAEIFLGFKVFYNSSW